MEQHVTISNFNLCMRYRFPACLLVNMLSYTISKGSNGRNQTIELKRKHLKGIENCQMSTYNAYKPPKSVISILDYYCNFIVFFCHNVHYL